jgi:universal stress protein E
MRNPRRILVAIKNPASRKQPALRKAAQLAEACGARLEMFHAIADPIYLDAFLMEGMSLEQTQKQWRDRLMKKLEKHAATLRQSGLKVDVSCDWDFPAYEAVIRRAARLDVDLIVAERHATQHMLPWLLRFNDWELLRRSPVPVLLVKRTQPYKNPTVLAAIDPSHGFAKPARLDSQIIETGEVLGAALGGKLHVVHAWPGAMLPMDRLSPISGELADTVERQAGKAARKEFDNALEGTGIPAARRHFIAGHPADAIPRLARQQRAALVVMGAISRSGLKRLVIGNIAEQVLDALPCDVLVVKPADFKPRVAGKGRGVQLVPTPPYM